MAPSANAAATVSVPGADRITLAVNAWGGPLEVDDGDGDGSSSAQFNRSGSDASVSIEMDVVVALLSSRRSRSRTSDAVGGFFPARPRALACTSNVIRQHFGVAAAVVAASSAFAFEAPRRFVFSSASFAKLHAIPHRVVRP